MNEGLQIEEKERMFRHHMYCSKDIRLMTKKKEDVLLFCSNLADLSRSSPSTLLCTGRRNRRPLTRLSTQSRPSVVELTFIVVKVSSIVVEASSAEPEVPEFFFFDFLFLADAAADSQSGPLNSGSNCGSQANPKISAV